MCLFILRCGSQDRCVKWNYGTDLHQVRAYIVEALCFLVSNSDQQ